MARASVSKTRAPEKSRPPTSVIPAVAHEIVPGKFNDTDWNLMLDRDGNEEFAAEVVDEILDVTMDTIFKSYLDRQLVPFTIFQAKDAIIEIIEWYFLARDEGEEHIYTDLGWAEDREPESAETDCWAQGSIPKSYVTAAPQNILQEIPEVQENETVSEINQLCLEEVSQEPVELPDAVSDSEGPPSVHAEYPEAVDKVSKISFETMKSETLQENQDEIKSPEIQQKIEPPDELEVNKPQEESIEYAEKHTKIQKAPIYCSSFIKTMLGHSMGNKDILFDEMGNIIAVPKIEPEKLPTHRVNVKYTVIDAVKEVVQIKGDTKKKQVTSNITEKSKLINSVPEISNKGHIRSSYYNMSSQKPTTGMLKTPKVSNSSGLADDNQLGNSVIEDIEVSQGIIVREGGRVKKGPGRYYGKLDILDDGYKGMKPVNLRTTNSGVTVADLLDRQSPILRPYGESSPLPPIVPLPSNKSVLCTD